MHLSADLPGLPALAGHVAAVVMQVAETAECEVVHPRIAYPLAARVLHAGRGPARRRRLGREQEGKSGYGLIITCGIAAVLQLAALFCTQSRGPVAGLVVAGYVCAFIFFVLSRSPRKDSRIVPFAAALLGIAVPLLVFAAARFLFKLPVAATSLPGKGG